MYAFTANVAFMVVVSIGMCITSNAHLLAANVAIAVVRFVNVSVSAGFAACGKRSNRACKKRKSENY